MLASSCSFLCSSFSSARRSRRALAQRPAPARAPSRSSRRRRGRAYSSAFKKPGATITCAGDCNATTKGTKHFALIGNRGLGGDRRGKNVAGIGIAVKRTCQGKPLGGGGFVLIFNKSTALVDKKKSKLS